MYCINCGVELKDSEKVCPLCGTEVYHPSIKRKEATPTFPPFTPNDNKMSKKGFLFIVTTLYVAAIAQLLICEFSISSTRGWAGYAIGAVILSYLLIVLPLWFSQPNPVIFVPCSFAEVLVYLLYIDLMTNGGWFLKFAFPAVGGYCILLTAVVTLVKYIKRGHLFIYGGAVIAHGAFMLMLEFLINNTFHVSASLKWSLFPLFGCSILGMGFILIGILKPVQEALKKKFFL